MRLGIAIRAFSAALFNRDTSTAIAAVLDGTSVPAIAEAATEPKKSSAKAATQTPKPVRPTRDAAVSLLGTLQREARLIDLVQEDLAQYSDAQVGAAARPCLMQCAQTLKRHFALAPVIDAAEGDTVTTQPDASAARLQWVGDSAEASKSQGKLIHHGWLATKVELSEWTGDEADMMIVAPAQVQA